MELALNGKIERIFETQTYPSGFKKREFILKTDDQYPQLIKIECLKDNCEKLSNFTPGENVKVSINLRGNEKDGKYYVSITAWRITLSE
jgi:hypothetical protein